MQCYTGIERPYIKQDYIARPEVLEYVVLKILTMDFDGFNEPAVCKQMLDVFEENNNLVLEFLYRFAPRLSWDLAPKTFLYALFRGWYASVDPTGKPKSLKEFWPLVEMACAQHGDELGWRVLDNPKRPGHIMDIPEPLIVEYVRDEKDLKKWTSPKYADGGRYEVVGLPAKPSGSYDGLIRVVPRPTEPHPPDVADLPVDQDGRAYTMDDPDADGELLRDEYCAYLAEHARIESEVAAGKAERDYRQGRSMSRGWFDGDYWCVNRFHPQQGDWLRVEYDGRPDDADEALQYGSWLSLRTDLRYADDPEYVGHAVLELALNKQPDDQE